MPVYPGALGLADNALGTTSTSGAMEPGAWREARFVAPLAWGLAKGDCVSLCPGGESLPVCRVAEGMS